MLYMPYEPDQKIITSASTFKISSGSLPLILENLSMHFSPGNIQVNTFPYDSLPEERANDFRIAVLFNARQQVIFETTTLTFRDQESFNFNVPTSLHDDDFVLLYYYVSDNFQEVTDSVSIQFWQ